MKKIKTILSKIYEAIFREKITPATLNFLKNFIYLTIGFGVAAVCVFVFEILSGRIFGPDEYGKYVLVGSIGLFLYFLMTLGVSTAMVNYLAKESDHEKQKKIISSSFLITFIAIFVFSAIFFVFSDYLSSIVSVPTEIFHLAIIFSLSYAFYTLVIDAFRGLNEMKKITFLRLGYGFLILTVFFAFISRGYISFKVAVFAICSAYMLLSLLSIFNLRRAFIFEFDKTLFFGLLKYGVYAMFGVFFFTLLPTFSKLMVNKFLDRHYVGVYNAYYFSSINIATFFYTTLITIFFPTASKYSNKILILNKIKKILPILFGCGIPFLFTAQLLILNFYGSQYPKDYYLMVLFAISGILMVVYGLYGWLFYSRGINGVKLITGLTIIIFIINIILNIVLIPPFFLYGAILSVALTYLLGVAYLFLSPKKLFQR